MASSVEARRLEYRMSSGLPILSLPSPEGGKFCVSRPCSVYSPWLHLYPQVRGERYPEFVESRHVRKGRPGYESILRAPGAKGDICRDAGLAGQMLGKLIVTCSE
jgi:hypothetical protein